VYSFQRALALRRGPGVTFSSVLKPENVVALDPKTVRFTLDSAYGPFLSAVPLMAIVNSAMVKKNEVNGDWGVAWLAAYEAGSGAYTVVPNSFKPSVSFSLRKNDQHFYGWSDNPAAPQLVITKGIGDKSVETNALISGDVDATNVYLNVDDVDRIEATGVAVTHKGRSLRMGYVFMNTTKPPLNNKNFRKCLSYAFNYDGLMKAVLRGNGVRHGWPLPVGIWGGPTASPMYTYDVKTAQEYCNRAKAEGAPVDAQLVYQANAGVALFSTVGEMLQADAKKLGLNFRVVRQTWANLSTSATKPETAPDLWMTFVAGYYPDPDNWIGQMYDSKLHGTWRASSFYKNPEVDQAIHAARTTMDQQARARLYERASRQIVEDAPAIYLFTAMDLRGMSKRIAQGFVYSPITFGDELRWIKVADK
jgi:peptide/nickel transport system substrate-binding protein